MKVLVLHRERETIGRERYILVATVDTPKHETHEALEYAYRWTQNFQGSWSMKTGEDANFRVHVMAPLPEEDGRTYGLRSSMIGDCFFADGTLYRVDPFGFEAIDPLTS